MSGQMLSSHLVVSSSRTVRPCNPGGGRWIGHWRTTGSNGLFSCATLTGCRGGHTPFIQAGVEMSNTSAEAVRPRLFSRGSFQGCGCWCRGWNCGALWGCTPPLHSIGDLPTAPHVCCCYQMNWWDVVRRVKMGVSIWGAVHLHWMDR